MNTWLARSLGFIAGFLMSFHSQGASARAILLEELTWMQAEQALKPETVIVIPLGAAAKEHGPHLKLKNDAILAEYYKTRVLETARDLVVDIVRSLARFGPKRFYILNTGVSTVRALQPAADSLAADGILMTFTDLRSIEAVEKKIRKQEGGTHADEIETSMILYMQPEAVDMTKAVKDYREGSGPLTRDANSKTGIYSPSGVWGDATLATREKGRIVTEAMVEVILRDIEQLRRAPIPVKK